MIFSLKNKNTETHISEFNILKNNKLYFDNTSINTANNHTLICIFDKNDIVKNFKVSLKNDIFKIAYRKNNTSFEEKKYVSDNEIGVTIKKDYQVRKWNLFIFSENEGEFSDIMTVEYNLNGENFKFDIITKGTIIGIDEKYILLTQNLKFDITKEYYNAFYRTEILSNGTDEKLMNEKRKEFLLCNFDLTAQIGSYKSLMAIINYFGYGDLLELREIWKNGDRYTSTKINNGVLDYVDNRLEGFHKTNQLQLIYKINEWDGTYDSDGLMNFVTVLLNTEEIFFKLTNLQKIIEHDYLPLNAKIVDIIGQQTAVLGVDARVWDNVVRTDEIDLNQLHSDGSFEFKSNVKNIKVEEHEILRKNKHFFLDATNGEYPPNKINSKLDDNIFEIEKVLEYDINSDDDLTKLFEDEDYLTKYDRSDFGLVDLYIKADLSKYSKWSFNILDSNDVQLYKSSHYDINTLSNKNVTFGVREIGIYKIIIYLFDFYGGVTIINNNNDFFNIVKPTIDFKLAQIDRKSDNLDPMNGKFRSIDFVSTFETNDVDNYIEVDCYDETLDINNWNNTNPNNNLILKFNSKNYDLRSLQLNTFQFNSIPVGELNYTRLTDYGYEYGKLILDVIGNGNSGIRKVGIKLFEHHKYDYIELQYNNTISFNEFYNEFISLIYSKPLDSPWYRYTANLQNFSKTDIFTTTPVLRIMSRSVGDSIDNIYFDTSFLDVYEPLVNNKDDFYSVMPINGYIRIHPKLDNKSGDLIINDKTYSGLIFNDINTLYDVIKNKIKDENLKASVFKYDDFIIISTREDLVITHPTFGIKSDVCRGVDGTMLKKIRTGSIVRKGVPFYAYNNIKAFIDGKDYTWTLTETLTGNIIDVQKSFVFRAILVDVGSYTLKLVVDSIYGKIEKIKKGFIIIE